MSPMLLQEKNIHQYPPWHLKGDGFILNYWITPQFIKRSEQFKLAPSPLGRMVQVLLVRYKDSPVGPYDELLILDHPLISKRVLTTIPKIYVSTHESIVHGQHLWGIPKEHATFEWTEHENSLSCKITHNEQHMIISIKKTKSTRSFYINSHHIPAPMLTIRQRWQTKRYQFSPKFRGRISKINHVEWQNTQSIFPDFSRAKYLQSFYAPEFNLIFPEAKITLK